MTLERYVGISLFLLVEKDNFVQLVNSISYFDTDFGIGE